MAGAMHKMAVYLGLVEDDPHYDDGYDSVRGVRRVRGARLTSRSRSRSPEPARSRAEFAAEPSPPRCPGAPAPPRRPTHATDLARITTLHPRTYNEARTIGEHFREGTPVIMNLTEMVNSDAKRLVNFAAGLIFGLHGSIDRVTNRVFLLCPANVEVTAEDKARIAERGFFNQS